MRSRENPNGLRKKIWDTGPYLALVMPKAPVLADGAEPNGVEHRVALEQYETDYRAWHAAERQFKRERAEFEKQHGQAVEIDAWHVDAGEMLGNDPRRYRETLPPGLTPGANVGASRKIM
jgi:hypothetical protein